MAQPPNITETFVREVDENLRRDQLRDFGKKYAGWLIAAVVAVPRRQRRLDLLAAPPGASSRSKQVDQLAQIYTGHRQGPGRAGAGAARRAVEATAARRVRASAHVRAARRSPSSRTTPSWRSPSISEIAGRQRACRSRIAMLALIRQTALEFDSLKPRGGDRPAAAAGQARQPVVRQRRRNDRAWR